MSAVTNVKFEEFQKFTKDPSALIIDVREPNELKETGTIPGSINIPCNNIFLFFVIHKSNKNIIFYSESSERCVGKNEQGRFSKKIQT